MAILSEIRQARYHYIVLVEMEFETESKRVNLGVISGISRHFLGERTYW